MNWSYRGSWLENDTPHATRVRGPRPAPRHHVIAHCGRRPRPTAPHHGFSTKLLATGPALRGQGSASMQGSRDSRRPLSNVRDPCALRAAPGGGVQAAGLCKCLFSLVFVNFFFVILLFLIPPRGESRGTGAGSRGGVGEGMMDGSGSRPPAPRSGVSTQAPGPSGTGSGALAAGPHPRLHRRPRPHPLLLRMTSCPV